jgi:AAA15 family ATPase/GTPase
MRITRISIKNYRSCADVVFEPHRSLSALIGPNGSGKTNVLSAIRLLPALCRNRPARYASDETGGTQSEIKTWYEIHSKKIVHTARLNLVTNEKNQDEIVSSEEEWYLYDLTGSKKKLGIPSFFLFDLSNEKMSRISSSHLVEWLNINGVDAKAISVLREVLKLVNGINYYGASQFTNPGTAPISFEVEGEGDSIRRTGISITGHKSLLYDLYQADRTNSDKYREFIDLIGPDGIGLIESIEFKEVITSSSSYRVKTGGKFEKKEKTNQLVIPSFKVAGNSLSPSQLSEGTFKTLALIFYLVTDASTILMIEEPEVCVHHGLLSSIVQLIKTYSTEKQIFISTHSDAVLDKLDIENVFRVKREGAAGTKVSNIRKSVKAKELAALRHYLVNEGSLGEYWKHGDLENV